MQGEVLLLVGRGYLLLEELGANLVLIGHL